MMRLSSRVFCAGVSLLGAFGCGSKSGSSTTYPDASVVDSGTPDSVSDASDGSRPAPMSGPGSQRVFSGNAHLLNNSVPCTNEVGATSDRWCAFTSNSLDFPSLFVVNVSKAAGGTPVTCGGTDPNCLRLTRGFAEESGAAGSAVPHAARFQGDTLTYFDVTGTAYGWRPGMPNGRVIAAPTTGDVHDCLPANRGTAIACLEAAASLASDPPNVFRENLLVGRLDSPDSPPLARVSTPIVQSPNDGNLVRFQYGFPSPAGDYFAWSSRESSTDPESLKVISLATPGTITNVANDVFGWAASPDGARWYWFGEIDGTSGTLKTAPFPGGANPVAMLPMAVDYRITRGGQIAALTMGRNLMGIADPAGAPTANTMIDTGVGGILQVSPEGLVAYFKNQNVLGLVDIYVNQVDATGTRCSVNTQISGEPFVIFTPGSAAVLWLRDDLNASVGSVLSNGMFTTLPDCRVSTVAADIAPFIEPAGGSSAVLFVDELSQTDGSLKIRGVTAQNTLAEPILVQTRIDGVYALTTPPYSILYTVNAGSAQDGLYFHTVESNGGQVADAAAGSD